MVKGCRTQKSQETHAQKRLYCNEQSLSLPGYCLCHIVILWPKRLYISVVQRNFEVPIARTALWLVNCFPIPASASGLKMITSSVGSVLKRKKHVLFMPEGNLVYLSQKIYRFRLGGFQQAYYHQAPLVPIVYVLKRRKIFGKEMSKHWVKMICVFGDPVLPPPLRDDQELPKRNCKIWLMRLRAGWKAQFKHTRPDLRTQKQASENGICESCSEI